ncbi:ankyrin repeat domain-containing protein [Paraflavitalea sp. CAU 1676]|uniref:ankyrin repeat domain-containing protein n=1 Tax=Paraflavitalea sp. CAU 1676 TaxID=3032598 RepID=UPI0023DAE591|nr:ankyrin repeat domain-containing protein [Paraflavitalea sp. CAU 1676]MDF2188038.1 hypothetical protein [Paraflavitalea sp. CAU 1676]
MRLEALPITARIGEYEAQGVALLAAYGAGDKKAMRQVKEGHPAWWRLTDNEFLRLSVTPADIQLVVAWLYSFESWDELVSWNTAVTTRGSDVQVFEQAVDAIVEGNISLLKALLQANPTLISDRSVRSHHSTLLHYCGTNGVEGYRQKYPANGIEVLQLLLAAGAEVDAVADMYGGSTTFGLVATSIHPAKAGILIPMLDLLIAAGASFSHPRIAGNGDSLINGCLHNGRPEAADYLLRKGAPTDLEGAAGTGQLDRVKEYFNADGTLKPDATRHQLENGFVWACEYGHPQVVAFLLDRGLDPNMAVDGMYGLHWGLVGGHAAIIELLMDRGASLSVRNSYGGNAIGCAIWALANSDEVYRWPEGPVDYYAMMESMLQRGAPIDEGMLGWLQHNSDFTPERIGRLDALFRRYGATT